MSVILGAIGPGAEQYWQSVQKHYPEEVFTAKVRPQATFACDIRHGAYQADLALVEDVPSQMLIAADAKLTNLSSLCDQLRLSPQSHDIDVVLVAYQRWGEACVDHLEGTFAFVIYDKRHQQAFAARDHFGVVPLFYHTNGENFYFSANIRYLNKPLGLLEQNMGYLEDLVIFMPTTQPKLTTNTLFNGIFRLHHAAYLIWQAQTPIKVSRYWHLQSTSISTLSYAEAQEGFTEHLFSAVKPLIPARDKLGLELSGGLDSAAITAVAHQNARKEQLIALTNSVQLSEECGLMDEQRYELPYAITICQHLNIAQKIFNDPIEVGALFDALIPWFGTIPQDLFAVFNVAMLRYAQKNQIATVLSGFGGDQFTSQLVPTFFQELLQQGQYGRLIYEKWRSDGVGRLGKSIVKHFLSRKQPTLKNKPLPWHYAIMEPLLRPVSSQKLHAYCHAVRAMKNTTQAIEQLYYDGLWAGLLQYRLECNYLGAKYYGIEYRYPLLKRQFVQFCHCLPLHYRYRHGRDRYLMRQLLMRYFPKNVARRPGKGGAIVPDINTRQEVAFQNEAPFNCWLSPKAFSQNDLSKRPHKHIDYIYQMWSFLNRFSRMSS